MFIGSQTVYSGLALPSSGACLSDILARKLFLHVRSGRLDALVLSRIEMPPCCALTACHYSKRGQSNKPRTMCTTVTAMGMS